MKRETLKRIYPYFVMVGLIFITLITSALDLKKEAPKGESLEERLGFLQGFGWEIDEKSERKKEIAIPMEFGEVYSSYNELQKSQGFDLEKYKGKRALQFNYRVLNHSEDLVFANILVYKGKIIAGEIYSPKINGFMDKFNTCYNKNKVIK